MAKISVDMKSLGRIGYEAYEEYNEDAPAHYTNWVFIDQAVRDSWETAAQAIVNEHERRKPEDEQQQLL